MKQTSSGKALLNLFLKQLRGGSFFRGDFPGEQIALHFTRHCFLKRRLQSCGLCLNMAALCRYRLEIMREMGIASLTLLTKAAL